MTAWVTALLSAAFTGLRGRWWRSRNSGPSIYEQIEAQAESSPNGPIDVGRIFTGDAVSGLPDNWPPGENDAQIAQDIEENQTGWIEPADCARVIAIIRRLDEDSVDGWQPIESATADVSAATCIDEVLAHLDPRTVVTPELAALFWDVALNSSRVESVKWGMTIGSFGLAHDQLPALLTLGRHPEFTVYVARVLTRESQQQPELKQLLVDLLARAHDWGLGALIEHIAEDAELIERPDVQRELLVRGVENWRLPGGSAETIAGAIDMPALSAAAVSDDRIFAALTNLWSALTIEDDGARAEWWRYFVDWDARYDSFVTLLEARAADIRLLGALRDLQTWLAYGTLSWPRRAEEQTRIAHLWQTRLSADAVREGLRDESTRSLALLIMDENELRELLP